MLDVVLLSTVFLNVCVWKMLQALMLVEPSQVLCETYGTEIHLV